MKISIVTPSFNQGRFLEATLRSVIEQDYPGIEYMVFDGGSTDGSVDIIRRYADRLAFWVSERDRGQSDAIQKGLLRATGDIFAWQNSDDTYKPGALAFVSSVFEAHPGVDLLFGGWELMDENGSPLGARTYHPVTYRKLRSGFWVPPQPAVFMRRAAVLAAGGLNIDCEHEMDFDLYLRMVRPDNIFSTPRILGGFRLHTSSKTISLPKAQLAAMQAIRRSVIRDASPAERLAWRGLDGYILFRDWVHRRLGVYSLRRRIRLGGGRAPAGKAE